MSLSSSPFSVALLLAGASLPFRLPSPPFLYQSLRFLARSIVAQDDVSSVLALCLRYALLLLHVVSRRGHSSLHLSLSTSAVHSHYLSCYLVFDCCDRIIIAATLVSLASLRRACVVLLVPDPLSTPSSKCLRYVTAKGI